MGIRLLIGLALSAAFLSAALASPVPASNATPGPSPNAKLGPVGTQNDAAPAASASPGQPKLIGHIYTSAACSSFVEHFNAAAVVVVANDQQMDSVDTTLRAIEDDWNRPNGAARVIDDRVALIGAVSKMLKTIPASQDAVNALLSQAKTTSDPQRKAALQEAASQLQRTVDRQRAVAYDLTSVIHVLEDKHTSEDTAEANIQEMLPEGYSEYGISLNDDPVPQAGQFTLMSHGQAPTPKPSPGATATPKPGSVEDILQWARQRSIIGDAEGKAAAAADRVVRSCDGEVTHSPPPSPNP